MTIIDRSSRVGWFADLSGRLGIVQDPEFNLLSEVPFKEGDLTAIRTAALEYIRDCMGGTGAGLAEQDLLEAAANTLANRTPNGVLMPKKEFQVTFNRLQGLIAEWLKGLDIDQQIYQISNPVLMRLAKGERNLDEEQRPYSSSKLHTDLWSGEPFDHVGIRIPILGDIEKTGLDFYHPPSDFEDNYFRHLADYDEAKEIEERAKKYPIKMAYGNAYFVDGSVLHKTVKKGGGVRVTLQIELRRTTPTEQRDYIENACDPDRLSYYIDPDEWFRMGVDRFMAFKDTYADAVKGIFIERSAGESNYDVVRDI